MNSGSSVSPVMKSSPARRIKMFPPDGRGAGDDFITGLPDDPEFIHHVPKTASPEGKP